MNRKAIGIGQNKCSEHSGGGYQHSGTKANGEEFPQVAAAAASRLSMHHFPFSLPFTYSKYLGLLSLFNYVRQ
jgi:hypothetical protein